MPVTLVYVEEMRKFLVLPDIFWKLFESIPGVKVGDVLGASWRHRLPTFCETVRLALTKVFPPLFQLY